MSSQDGLTKLAMHITKPVYGIRGGENQIPKGCPLTPRDAVMYTATQVQLYLKKHLETLA